MGSNIPIIAESTAPLEIASSIGSVLNCINLSGPTDAPDAPDAPDALLFLSIYFGRSKLTDPLNPVLAPLKYGDIMFRKEEEYCFLL